MLPEKAPPDMYEPREDSQLLLRLVPAYAKGRVLDMGTGTGILAAEAAKHTPDVTGADIDSLAVKYCRQTHPKIRFVISDLFSSLGSARYDLVIFNPPYLPSEKKAPDIALDGGKHGHELIGRFLDSLPRHISEGGKALLLYSSLTGVQAVQRHLERNSLTQKIVATEKLDFETLYAAVVELSEFASRLKKRGICRLRLFAKGRRGEVYTGKVRGKLVAIKRKRKESTAVGRIENEAKVLEFVNHLGIGPKLLWKEHDCFAYWFAQGKYILDFLRAAGKDEAIGVLCDVLCQAHALDRHNISKGEMHRLHRHIIVSKRTVMIDFERARRTDKPKNVTQFCQFVKSQQGLLAQKKIFISMQQLKDAAWEYSRTRDIESLRQVLGCARKYGRSAVRSQGEKLPPTK